VPSDVKPRLEDWFVGRAPSTLQAFQIKQIKALDAQCVQCLKRAPGDMMCDGVRLTYSPEASQLYGSPQVSMATCSKLRQRQEVGTLDRRLAASVIPTRVVRDWQRKYTASEYPKVQLTDDGVLVEECLLPEMAYELHTEAVHQLALHTALSLIHRGYNARCVLVPLLLDKYPTWSRFISDFGPGLDFLALERYDLGNAPGYVIEHVIELLRYRKENGLMTLVTVGETPRARNAQEEQLYAEMQTWGSISEVYDAA
jgi:hypothetical protein